MWWLLAPLPTIEKRGDGLYRAGGEADESAVAADCWFAVTVLVVGIAVAALVYLRTRPGRVAPLLGLTVGGLVGSLAAWQTGMLLGPAALVTTARGLDVGARFEGPLTVSALGVLVAWPLGAVITYFAVAAGAETSEHQHADADSHSRADSLSGADPGRPPAPR